MADKIIDIIRKAIEVSATRNDIKAGYGLERQSYTSRGNSNFNYEQQYNRYWITADPIKETPVRNTDIILYRNAPIAIRMQEKNVGEEFDMTIRGMGNDAGAYFHHHALVQHYLDFDENTINHPDGVYIFDTLEKYLRQLEGIQQRLDEQEAERKRKEEEAQRAKDEAERKQLEKEIRKIEKERQKLQEYKEEINNLTRYIHNQVQLRFKPIVDTVQTKIKTSHLYDGTAVIIDGGPGTGKTTTMISRLKYLTDTDAIRLDNEQGFDSYKLSPSNRRELEQCIENDKDWVFFSPSQLLKLYLENAMVNEKLKRPNQKVHHWAEWLGHLMQEYGFFDLSRTDNPIFTNAKEKHQRLPLIANKSGAVEQLTEYFVGTFKNAYANLPNIKDIRADWKRTAVSIANRMENIDKLSLRELIDLFTSLNSLYQDECKPYQDERANLLERTTNTIAAKLRLNEQARQAVLDLMRTELPVIDPEDPDGEDSEIQTDDEENEQVMTVEDENEKIVGYVRRWIEPFARSWHSKYPLSERQQKFTDTIFPLLSETDIQPMERIASLYIFRQYAKWTRGTAKIILAGIPGKYKRFRRTILKDKKQGWNLEMLQELIEKSDNTRLHPQEQALLIGFVNHLVLSLLKRSSIFSHKYITCYQEYCRPIIGIDEATDFSDIDIYAMCSFAHKDFSAITLSGDLMQRLTTTGIQHWEELQNILPQYDVMPLVVSYRQSTKMLDVARRLYIDTIGEKPTYRSHMRESKVPEAIALIETNKQRKIEWIEQRIKEIFTAYGNTLPSIAIFLNDEDSVASFARSLKETDFFEDNAIPIVDGSQNTLGNRQQVRIYPINKVKGMEFDVVFFIDINNTEWSEEVIKRYLYVGVSRAAFFLGVTLTEDVPALTKYFKVGQDWKDISKQDSKD